MLIWPLGIFQWQEVEQFCNAFFVKSKSNAAIANICKPAVERWQKRYKSAIDAYKQARDMFERTKKTGNAVLMANAENNSVSTRSSELYREISQMDDEIMKLVEQINQPIGRPDFGAIEEARKKLTDKRMKLEELSKRMKEVIKEMEETPKR